MKTEQTVRKPAPPILGVHHTAFRCRDAAETRHFYEEILGLQLNAAEVMQTGMQLTAAFATEVSGTTPGKPAAMQRVLTLFFGMRDGNYITFFDAPTTVNEDRFPVRDGVEEYHFAMEVGSWEELVEFKQRLQGYDIAVYGPMNHEACHSIYFFDPNGLSLEILVRDRKHDAIMAHTTASSPTNMSTWASESDALKQERLAGTEAKRAKREEIKRRMAAHINAQLPTYTP